jgi:hypothetical protein
MNPSEQEIEKLLRQAPSPNPPPGLRQEILKAAPGKLPPGSEPVPAGWLQSWLNSWRFAVAAACLALAALGVATAQQAELQQLRQQLEELRQQLESRPATPPTSPVSAVQPTDNPSRVIPAAPRTDRDDLERLRAEAAKLQTDAASLSQLNAENTQLRGELAALVQEAMPGEFEAMREAKQRAQRIACINNLKQLGLAVRLYESDNHGVFPKDMLSMSNELSTPKILVCPADTNRLTAASWSTYTPANLSYEYLAADGDAADPTRVLFRCSVHRGSVGLVDGSVQQLSEPMQAQRLVLRDGKLYLDAGAPIGGGR